MLNSLPGQVHVFMEFTAAAKKYECMISLHATLYENLQMLYQMVKDDIADVYLMPEDVRVYEKNLMAELPLDAVCKKLNISDGQTFMIY